MKHLQKLLVLVALTPMLAACSSPKKICAHVMDITVKSAPEGTPPPSEDDMKRYTETCLGKLEKEKKELGEEKYKEMVKCVMATTDMPGIMKCNGDAAKGE